MKKKLINILGGVMLGVTALGAGFVAGRLSNATYSGAANQTSMISQSEIKGPDPSFFPAFHAGAEVPDILRDHTNREWSSIYDRFNNYMLEDKGPEDYRGRALITKIAENSGIAVTYLLESAILNDDQGLFLEGLSAAQNAKFIDDSTRSVLNYFNSRAQKDWNGFRDEIAAAN